MKIAKVRFDGRIVNLGHWPRQDDVDYVQSLAREEIKKIRKRHKPGRHITTDMWRRLARQIKVAAGADAGYRDWTGSPYFDFSMSAGVRRKEEFELRRRIASRAEPDPHFFSKKKDSYHETRT